MNVFLKSEVAENYDEYYKTDFGKKVDEIEKELISELIKDFPYQKMLELGCGTGHWTEFFLKQGFDVIGIDTSEAMLNIAKQKKLNAEFLHADTQNIPFENESFNIISTLTMLEFVENQKKTFSEIKRVLKHNGYFIAGCLNANSILGKTKDSDETFKNAKFLNPNEFKNHLQIFGEPVIKFGVYVNDKFEIIDNTNEQENVAPIFMAALVQKTK